jgi:hypothetical protein
VGVTAAAERLSAMCGSGLPDPAAQADPAWAARAAALTSAGSELHRSLAALLPRCPPAGAAALAGPLETLAGVVARTAAPAFGGAADAAAAAIARSHAGAPYGPAAAASSSTPSPWVGELGDGLAGFRAGFLARLVPPLPSSGGGEGGGGGARGASAAAAQSIPSALLTRLASRVAALTVRHACLARPVAQPAGAAQLARDLAEVEAAVVEECGVSSSGRRGGGGGAAGVAAAAAAPPHPQPLAALRALRRLVLIPTPDLAAPASRDLLRALDPVDAAHFLLGRGPAVVESPASAAGQPPPAYGAWLDAAPPGAALAAVRAAVAAAGSAAHLEPSAAVVVPLLEEVCGKK